MSIQIRVLKDSELEKANDFFNKIYKTNRSFEAFEWEFIKGPIGKSIYVAAFDTDKPVEELIGIQCVIPLEFITSENEIILTAKSEDTLVNPLYRGQDIFGKMYALLFEECKKQGIKYIWGFTPAYKPFIKLGFTLDFRSNQGLFISRIHNSFEFLSSLNPKNTFSDKFKIYALCILSKLKTIQFSLVSNLKIECEELKELDDRFIRSNLFLSDENSKEAFLHQNKKYLEWRIVQNKFSNKYQLFQFSLNGEVGAHVIINNIKNIGYIEQVLFHKNLTEQKKLAILKRVIKLLLAQKVSCIRFLAFNENQTNKIEYSLLKKTGFSMINRGNWFVWKSLDDQSTIESKNVFITRLFTQGNA
jgi:hypothetical protein